MSAIRNIIHTLFPSTCICCGDILVGDESQICLSCLAHLPHTYFSQQPDNPAEMMLAGRIPFVSATAMLFYSHGNATQTIVHDMKFHGNSDLCVMMGTMLGIELLSSGRFDDVDLLLPVPLHWTRRISRGYNQSLLLFQGVQKNFHSEISIGCLYRHRPTRKQSLQHQSQRASNVYGAFRVKNQTLLSGKHVLLIDDVMTTGATLTSCCDALRTVPDIKISIAVLSMVQ